jgi:hypothetical protein
MADPATSPPLTRASVQAAHELIRPFVHRTPTLANATLTRLASTPRPHHTPAGDETDAGALLISNDWADAGARVPAAPTMRLWLKCENFQRVGAFKVRGAFRECSVVVIAACFCSFFPCCFPAGLLVFLCWGTFRARVYWVVLGWNGMEE